MEVSLRAKKMKRNVTLVYLMRVAACAYAFSIATIVKYWQDHGLSLMQVTTLQLLFAVALMAGQGPTGYFADLFTRTQSIRIGAAVQLVGALMYAIAGTFAGFLVAEIVIAVGMAFTSGADRALLRESLAELGEEISFDRHWGRALSVSMAWQAGATLAGGAVALWSASLPLWLAAALIFVQFLSVGMLTEPKRRQFQGRGALRDLAAIASVAWHNPRLRGLIASSSIMLALTQLGLWLYQPYFENCGLPLGYWGLAFFTFNVTASVASWNAVRIERALPGKRGPALLVALLVTGYLLLGAFTPVAGFVFVLTHQLVRGLTPVWFGAAITAESPEEVRATMASFESICFTALYAAFLLPVGWSADVLGISMTFTLLAGLSVILGTIALCLVPVKK